MQVRKSEGKWIDYQIMYGFGLGIVVQVPILAARTSLPTKDMSIGMSLILFGTLLGVTVYVAVGESVLLNQLSTKLAGIQGIDPSHLASAGATSVITSLPKGVQELVRSRYNETLHVVFITGLVPCCLGVLGTALLEWNSVKEKPATKGANTDVSAVAE